MRIALVQQHATGDREDNLKRGLDALVRAAEGGADLVCYAELAFEPFYPQKRAEGASSLVLECPFPSLAGRSPFGVFRSKRAT